MLSPRYLDGLSDELVEIYSRLETDILQDMARRVAKVGKITDATKWQAAMLAEAGGIKKNIYKLLKKYDRKVAGEVARVYTEAMQKNTATDNRIFKEATGRTVSTPNAQQMLATIQKCHSDLSRLTLTTAATTETEFIKQANRVYIDVQSGAFDYDTAMKSATDEMAKRGITAVQYRNGKPVTLTIEHAVRMNILTSINQTAADMTLNNLDELDCDLVETSAHAGARPEHEAWQGQIFSISGKSSKYRPFSVCGLGSVTGICGINCKHSFYPYFEGMEKHYTADDLDELASQEVNYNGQKMTRYEGEQELRHIEKNIRAYKRRAVTEQAAGVDNTAACRKLGEWQAKARDFTQQTGIQRDYAREYIGTKNGKQPSGIVPNKGNTTPPTVLKAGTTSPGKTAPQTKRETVKASSFPSAFTKGAEKKNTEAFADFINSQKNADPEVVRLYANIGKLENYSANGITFKISHAKKHSLSTVYSSFTGELKEVKLTIPKIDPKYKGTGGTTLHEIMHMLDNMARPDPKLAGDLSSTLTFLQNAVKSRDGYTIPAETQKRFAAYNKLFNDKSAELYAQWNKTYDELLGQVKAHKMSWAEFSKAKTKARNAWETMRDNELRNIDAGMDGLQDIYDALTGGQARNRGLVKYGHDLGYFNKYNNRISEILADYGNISVTRPDLVEILKKDNPDLVDALNECIKEINKRIK